MTTTEAPTAQEGPTLVPGMAVAEWVGLADDHREL